MGRESRGSFRKAVFLDLDIGYTYGQFLKNLLGCALIISSFFCMLYFNKK